MRILLLSLICISALYSSTPEFGRYQTWTNAKGQSLEAAYLGTSGAKVSLQLLSGKTSLVPIQSLSSSDQEWIQRYGWPLDSSHWFGWSKSMSLGANAVQFKKVDDSEYRNTFESEHFRVKCSTAIDNQAWKQIFRQLELFFRFMESSPWGVAATPRHNDRFEIVLTSDEYHYQLEGGSPGSAGIYIPSKQLIFTHLVALGLRPRNYFHEPKIDLSVLTHELTHMLMDDYMFITPAWLLEGMAEYVSFFPLTHGKVNPREHLKRAQDAHLRVAQYERKSILRSGPAPQPQDVFRLPLAEWQSGEYTNTQGESIQNTDNIIPFYNRGFLICYYLLHSSQDSTNRLRNYLHARRQAAPPLLEQMKQYQAEKDAYQIELRKYRGELLKLAREMNLRPQITPGQRRPTFEFPEGTELPPEPIAPQLPPALEQGIDGFSHLGLLYPPSWTEEQFFADMEKFLKKQGFQLQ